MADLNDVIQSVREHLERKGYKVTHSTSKYGTSEEMVAKKDQDTFFIEAIGKSSHNGVDIAFAIGRLVERMKQQGVWFHYAVAMPRDYFGLLKDFEVSGIDTLKIHFFFTANIYTLTHLDPKEVIELIKQLKAGNPVNPELVQT